MNPKQKLRCECIIAHPSQPKFMVVHHENGKWAPPTVQIPGDLDITRTYSLISAAILKNYGLKVSVLRHLTQSGNYHCFELELLRKGAARPLKAVWAGREAYYKVRNPAKGEQDAFTQWLEAAARGSIPSQRLPWERKGWLHKVRAWIVRELGKRNISPRGDLQQYKVWQLSAVLTLETSAGRMWFKASSSQPPNEAALLDFLVANWPEMVPAPLALDLKRDWVLMEDYGLPANTLKNKPDFSGVMQQMAAFQTNSINRTDDWKRLGCADFGMLRLRDFMVRLAGMHDVLQTEPEALNDQEISNLQALVAEKLACCERMSEYAIPETLVHQDFRPGNLFPRNDGFWIVDWDGAVLSHPFFTLIYFLKAMEGDQAAAGIAIPGAFAQAETPALVAAFNRAYSGLESEERLREVFVLAKELFPFWMMMIRVNMARHSEPGSMTRQAVELTMRKTCRSLLELGSAITTDY